MVSLSYCDIFAFEISQYASESQIEIVHILLRIRTLSISFVKAQGASYLFSFNSTSDRYEIRKEH